MLKHTPKDSLATIENHLLYSQQKVQIYGNDNDRHAHYTTTNATALNRTNLNLTDMEGKN